MEMTGEHLINAPQSAVWKELNEPETLKACMPGCEAIEAIGENAFRIEILAAVGPVKARFKGTLKLSDVVPPERYVLAFEGSGGAAGFARGGAQVSLVPEGASTRLAYKATAQVGGKLAQVGSRLVDGVAKKLVEEFFERFDARFAPAVAAPVSEIVEAKSGSPLMRSRAALVVAIIVLVLIAAWIVRSLVK